MLASCTFAPQGDATGAASRGVESPAPTGDAPGDGAPGSDGNAISGNGNGTSAPSLCPAGPFAASPLPSSGAQMTLVASPSGADWSEGPVWLAGSQALLFSAASLGAADAQGPPTTVYKLVLPNTLTVYAATGTLRSNGLAVDANGDVFAATHDVQAIARLPGADVSKRINLVTQFGGKAFNSPNDLALRKDGTIYFVDPTYEQAGRAGQEAARVYRIATDGNVTVVDATRNQPNGIVLSLDQKWLYVGGADHVILRYAVADDGSTGPSAPWATTTSNIDGMTVDCAGNIYATLNDNKVIGVYAPDGTLLGTIPCAVTPSNLAFGGPDQKTLFITGSGKLYTLPMPIPGLPY